MCKALGDYGEQKEMIGVIKLGKKLGWTDEKIIGELVEMFKVTAENAKKLLRPTIA